MSLREAGEGPLSLRIQVEPLRGSRLVRDLLAGSPALAAFYDGFPLDPAAYRAKLDEVRSRFDRLARERAAAALRPTSDAAAERLRRFVEEGGAMVTTGQQAGLFTGPLYTVHKILTAVRLAEALERELGVVVLPVFWAASEDHDFAEVNHAFAVSGDGDLHRVAVSATTSIPVPMSEMRLGEDVESALGKFAQTIGIDGDRHPDLMSIPADAYRPGETVGEAFMGAIVRLFAGFDLCVTHAADPAVKRASAWVMVGELERAAEHERLVVRQTERLGTAGYAAPVTVVEGAANVFYHGPAGRERLAREDGAFVAADARRRFSLDDLRAIAETEPETLSPNVFLRPVVESAAFPTLAYVGGPAETAYFGQIRPLFESFGIRMPLVFPRFGATIVPEEVDEARGGIEIEDADLALPEHEIWERVARRHLPEEIARRVGALQSMLIEEFGRLMDAAEEIDWNLDLAIGTRRNRAMLEVAKADRTIVRHFKQRNPELHRAMRLIRNHLRPNGIPQERVLTVFQYLAREPRLLERLAEGMTVELRREPVPALAGD
ncbi:MAG TPA: bacillithiol biosynthesis cysteine-adding enzyme BshC [Longimicrobium sp.]|nr:bacillithiol biosynthesis cysteine-adding enzyme BshC [Longimicrobium sp.]